MHEDTQMNLNTVDLHIHAGIERPEPMDEWIDTLLRTGRKALGLLDHYELYLKPDVEYADYLVRKGFPPWYANGIAGYHEFCQEVRQQGERCDAKVLLGLEVYHGDFPDIREEFLDGLDFVGCHISKTESFEPWSEFLLHAASKLSQTAHRYGLTGVLFHPFDHSFWHHRQGNTPLRGLRIVEPSELHRFADKMASYDICIEINWGSDCRHLGPDGLLEEYCPVIEALRARQVPFWLGSDVHHSADAPYDMHRLCAQLGIGEKDIWNPLVP